LNVFNAVFQVYLPLTTRLDMLQALVEYIWMPQGTILINEAGEYFVSRCEVDECLQWGFGVTLCAIEQQCDNKAISSAEFE